MITSVSFLKIVVPWLINIFYMTGLLQQVLLNFRQKSTKAISTVMLWMLFSAYALNTLYVLSLDLPFAYKIFVPSKWLIVALLLVQQWYYAPFYSMRSYLISGGIISALTGLGVLTWQDPIMYGAFSGWIATFFWAIYEIPQMIKNYYRRSVKGLSFYWILQWGIAAFLEILYSFAFNLPSQTKVTSVRAFLYVLIFLYQFMIYGSCKSLNAVEENEEDDSILLE